jgi:hypothetical protein
MIENNLVRTELLEKLMPLRAIHGGRGEHENRKTFSHREHRFPTREGAGRLVILRFL